MQSQDPARDDARELVAALLRRHVFGVAWVGVVVQAQRHRALPSELLTWTVRGRPG